MEPTYLSWSQSGFYQESIRSPSGVYQESIRSLLGVHTLYQESIRSPSGVHQEYQDFIRTPDGVHQDAWGSVTYSISTISSRILKICWPRWPINFILSSSDLKQGIFFWPLRVTELTVEMVQYRLF